MELVYPGQASEKEPALCVSQANQIIFVVDMKRILPL